jgi:flagellar biogenesis protein FliO
MKKLLLLLLLSSTLLLANVGKITAIKGDVVVTRDTKELPAKVGFILELKDTVITKDNSKALVLLNDKTSITVGKNSDLGIENFILDLQKPAKSEATFKFGKGIFRTITGQIGKINKEKFKIKTKSASIGIRGTVFLVEVQPDILKIGVEDGGIFMSPLDQNIDPQEIQKGEVLTYNDVTKEFKVEPLAEWTEAKQEQEESQEMKKEEEKALEEEKKGETPQEEQAAADEETPQEEQAPADEETPQEEQAPAGNEDTQTEQDVTQQPTGTGDDFGDVDTDSFDKEVATVELGGDVALGDQQNEEQGTQNTQTPDTLGATPIETGVDLDSINDIAETINDAIDTAEDTVLETTTTDAGTTTTDAGTSTTEAGTSTTDAGTTTTNTGDPSSSIPNINDQLQAITTKIINDHSETYMEFGYIATDAADTTTATSTYITGDITPTEVIQSYITGGTSASYSGGVSSLVNGTPSSGTVNINVDFSQQTLSGTINVTQGNWQANINSGTVTPIGISSTSITGTSSYGDIDSGALSGKFYGTSANSVGGTVNLNAGSNSANGVFGGVKQ